MCEAEPSCVNLAAAEALVSTQEVRDCVVLALDVADVRMHLTHLELKPVQRLRVDRGQAAERLVVRIKVKLSADQVVVERFHTKYCGLHFCDKCRVILLVLLKAARSVPDRSFVSVRCITVLEQCCP